MLESQPRRKDSEISFTYQSYLQPGTPYRYDIAGDKLEALEEIQLDFDISAFETRQVFYQSKDGTTVPMIMTYRKGMEAGW